MPPNESPEVSRYVGKYNYTAYVKTRYVGSKAEESFSVLDDYEESSWDAMTKKEQEAYLEDVARGIVFDGTMMEWGFEESEDDD